MKTDTVSFMQSSQHDGLRETYRGWVVHIFRHPEGIAACYSQWGASAVKPGQRIGTGGQTLDDALRKIKVRIDRWGGMMGRKIRTTTCGLLMFDCPACGNSHGVPTKQYPHKYPGGPEWNFNRNFESPTLQPSLNITSGPDGARTTCHIFVTDGRIQYLSDCTHAMAGQTVDMQDVESPNMPFKPDDDLEQ